MIDFKKLPIEKQVAFTFGALCLILIIIGSLFFFSLRSIERHNQSLQSRSFGQVGACG